MNKPRAINLINVISKILFPFTALAPTANQFENKIRQNPLMHDPDYLQNRLESAEYLTLPALKNNKRVLYKVLEHDKLLDSSNMTNSDWIHIANDVFDNYEKFDGFVILHGTDTLCYSAAALSFMFENLGKTVIITGSQVSHSHTTQAKKSIGWVISLYCNISFLFTSL